MNITITEKNTFSREFFIDIPWSEIDQDFNKFTVDFSKKIKIPGFRPGKVPKKILMDRFQPSIEAEFVENTVNRYYSKALEEKEITPVNQGSVSDIDFKFGAFPGPLSPAKLRSFAFSSVTKMLLLSINLIFTGASI